MKTLELTMPIMIMVILCCITFTSQGAELPCDVITPVCASTIIQLRVTAVTTSEWKPVSNGFTGRTKNVDLTVEKVLKPWPSPIQNGHRLSATIFQRRSMALIISDWVSFWDQFNEIEPSKTYVLFSRMEGNDIAAMMKTPMAWSPIDEESTLIEDLKYILENAGRDDHEKNRHLLEYLKQNKGRHGKYLGEYAGDLIARDNDIDIDLDMLVKNVCDYKFNTEGLRWLVVKVQIKAKAETRNPNQVASTKLMERLATMTLLLLADENSNGVHGAMKDILPFLLKSDASRSAIRNLELDDKKKSALKAMQNSEKDPEKRDELKSLEDLLERRQ
jgi:hypothetical protein